MYCSKCGTQVDDEARFCSNCGNAIAQNASQPNASQPNASQPNASQSTAYQPPVSHNSEPKKGGVTIVYPDGHSEIGDIFISATEIVFVRKSKAVRIAFGFLGSHIEKGEEKLRFNVSDIAGGKRTRLGLNSNVYQITMNNGDTYSFCVNLPKTITYLEEVIGYR